MVVPGKCRGTVIGHRLAPPLQAPILGRMESPDFSFPQARQVPDAPRKASARFAIGDVVRHKLFDFRGVIFDIDPVFANSEEWYEAIPEGMRPRRDQPFYHLMAENEDASYIAYVSQQNLLADGDGGPVDHPGLGQLFDDYAKGRYRLHRRLTH